MVGIGSLLIFLSVLGFFWRKVLKKRTFPKWLMWLFVATGPLSMLAIEFGWIFACTGRQPWVIYRVMLTADAVTGNQNLATLFVAFSLIYVLLGVAVVLVLRYYFKRHPIEDEINEIPLSPSGVQA
jgi:cytochrome d ubiquinol oxidase subunit I